MANDNATTGTDTITQTADDDTLTISADDQIQGDDFFDGGKDNNTILVSTATPGNLFLFNVTTDPTHGFHNYGALSFVGAAFTAVWLGAAQFGAGLISTSLAISGTDGVGGPH